jgi:hypothetical protein
MVLPDEQTSIFHIIRRQQRRQKKLITRITDAEGVRHTTWQDIRKIFYQELNARFAHIPVQEQRLEQLCAANIHTLDEEEKAHLEKGITYHELRTAVIQAPKGKSPGADGISSELYEWELEIMKDDMLQLYNHFFQTGDITSIKKKGVIICLPKHTVPERVQDYRPLTLLNADHKIYARIPANRSKPTLNKVIHDFQ